MPAFKFISSPDFFNIDIADLSGGTDASIAELFGPDYAEGITAAPGWSPEIGNGVTPEAVRVFLDSLTAMMATSDGEAKAFLVAGDLINGRWPQNAKDLIEVFGGADQTLEAAIRTAADVYYSWYQKLFDEAGVPEVIAALGDHEIGDNDWGPGSVKAANVPLMKEVFGEHLVDPLDLPDTWNGLSTRAPEGAGNYDEGSYIRIIDGTLFLSVDVFEYETAGSLLDANTGTVRMNVSGAHLGWISDILAAADSDDSIEHVIVQGHTPVLGPVNIRFSSALQLDGGVNSEFWQALQEHGTNVGGKVRAYISGEVHATTVIEDESSGIVQITHGDIGTNLAYIVFSVEGGRITGEEYLVDYNVSPDNSAFQIGSSCACLAESIHQGPRKIGGVEIDISSGQTEIQTTGNLDAWSRSFSGMPQIVGSDQGDQIQPKGNRDIAIFAGEGNDRVTTKNGSDFVSANAGHDRVRTSGGDDTIMGGIGNDTLSGANGNDMLHGGNGTDRLKGGSGADRIFGSEGNDKLVGGGGDDVLAGGGNNDLMLGRNGDDLLRGGAGDDTLIGAKGDDTLKGGRGSDQFVFNSDAGDDLVSKFKHGEDLIEIRSGARMFDDLDFTQIGNAVLMEFADTTVLIRNADAALFSETDFIFT